MKSFSLVVCLMIIVSLFFVIFSSTHYQGEMSEVRFFKRALTPEEVKTLYLTGIQKQVSEIEKEIL